MRLLACSLLLRRWVRWRELILRPQWNLNLTMKNLMLHVWLVRASVMNVILPLTVWGNTRYVRGDCRHSYYTRPSSRCLVNWLSPFQPSSLGSAPAVLLSVKSLSLSAARTSNTGSFRRAPFPEISFAVLCLISGGTKPGRLSAGPSSADSQPETSPGLQRDLHSPSTDLSVSRVLVTGRVGESAGVCRCQCEPVCHSALCVFVEKRTISAHTFVSVVSPCLALSPRW